MATTTCSFANGPLVISYTATATTFDLFGISGNPDVVYSYTLVP